MTVEDSFLWIFMKQPGT